MSLTEPARYVGFGFGAIQAGLFLYEAFAQGPFAAWWWRKSCRRWWPPWRRAGRCVLCQHSAPGPRGARPGRPGGGRGPGGGKRPARLVEAVAGAEEIGTARASVKFYVSDGPAACTASWPRGCAARLPAGGPRAWSYCCREITTTPPRSWKAAVLDEIPPASGMRSTRGCASSTPSSAR